MWLTSKNFFLCLFFPLPSLHVFKFVLVWEMGVPVFVRARVYMWVSVEGRPEDKLGVLFPQVPPMLCSETGSLPSLDISD